jgi:hypothetical protein
MPYIERTPSPDPQAVAGGSNTQASNGANTNGATVNAGRTNGAVTSAALSADSIRSAYQASGQAYTSYPEPARSIVRDAVASPGNRAFVDSRIQSADATTQSYLQQYIAGQRAN